MSVRRIVGRQVAFLITTKKVNQQIASDRSQPPAEGPRFFVRVPILDGSGNANEHILGEIVSIGFLESPRFTNAKDDW